MRPGDLWQHSSFRLAMGVTLFILVALMFASGVGYGLMQSQLLARQDARLTEIFSALEQINLQADDTDLIEAITTRITASPDRATVYVLKDQTGRILAANIADLALPAEWSTVKASDLGVATEYPYRLLTRPLGRNSLTVGLTNADLEDLRKIIMASFGWAVLFAFLATVVLGVVLAVRVQARLSLSETAVARLAQGDLSARLPVSARGDDLDRISQAINASLARLAALVDAMRQVSTDIAHDLRTPLHRLRIHIEDAARKVLSGDAIDVDLAAAIAQSEAIDQTFAALLRIAQIEGGSRQEKFAAVDLAGLMQNVAEIYAEVAVDAGQILTCDCTAPAGVMGDKELLTQLLVNLIENAIRHCPAGTVIRCAVQSDDTKVTASVCDTGPGIPVAEREKVLRRLYRLEKSRSSDGAGLGLALVKAVADLHGGTIILQDARPGLCVDVQFPLAAAGC